MRFYRAILDNSHRLLAWILQIRPVQNGDSRVLRYLKRRSHMRLDVVRLLGIEHGRGTEPISPEEMAAIA